MCVRLICGLQDDEAAGAMQVALGVPQTYHKLCSAEAHLAKQIKQWNE
jgi:hypothetical protein